MTKRYTIINHRLHIDGVAVEFKPTPNVSGSMTPDTIVMHDTASGLTMGGPVSWLCNPAAKASAHFVLGRDASVVQLAYTNRKTWHAGKSSLYGRRNVNNFSVGIEMVNPGWLTSKDNGKTGTFSRGAPTWDAKEYGIRQVTDDAHPGRYYWMAYTDEQIAAAFEICAALKAYYTGIKYVVGHYDISPGRKVDPNPLFPMPRLRDYVLRNRGPVVAEEKQSKPIDIPSPTTPPAVAEVDEHNTFDAVTITNLNMRPWPDSPNRFGVIKVNAPVDIIRQSVSQKDGLVWYVVAVDKAYVTSKDGGRADADGKFRGFVHGNFIRLVD